MSASTQPGFPAEVEFELPEGYVDAAGALHRRGTMRLATAADHPSHCVSRGSPLGSAPPLSDYGQEPAPGYHSRLSGE